MKALVVVAALRTAKLGEPPRRRLQQRAKERRAHAERLRFTDRDLEEMLGNMAPTPPPAPPLVLPEPDFIRWDPTAPSSGIACIEEPPLAA